MQTYEKLFRIFHKLLYLALRSINESLEKRDIHGARLLGISPVVVFQSSTHLTITCSKSTVQKKMWNTLKVNNKNTRMTTDAFPCVSIVDFEQGNSKWVLFFL